MKRRGSKGMYSVVYFVLTIVVFYLVDSVIGLPVAPNNGGQTYDRGSNIETLALSTDERFIQLYSEMINVLQTLNILPTSNNASVCMALEGVKRQYSHSDSTESGKQIGVFLYFKEASVQEVVYPNRRVKKGRPAAICKQLTPRGLFAGLDSDSLKQGNGNYTKQKPENITTIVYGENGSKTVGLSNTQVAVIVTCAIVLGSFFIIAGALRVRSCVKRYRTSRDTALGVDRRTSTFGLNGSNPSTGNTRRDSSSSKASRQSNTSFKSGDDLQINTNKRAPSIVSHNASQMHNNDHKPLLPVRSVTQGSETGSSHGSLAYIDEESQSKNKPEDAESNESDIESEENPLLRKSPDSGSSIDITMADVYKTENESVESTESYREIFEPNGDRQLSDTNDVEENNDGPAETETNKTSEESMVVDDDSSIIKRSSSIDTDPEFDSEVNRRPSFPKHQYSIDSYANECGEWEYGNGIYVWPEEDIEEDTNIADSFAVTIGLSQSNNSISNNPSYCYGNQAEYVFKSGYGNTAYISPYQPTHLDNYPLFNEGMNLNEKTGNVNCKNGQDLSVDDNIYQNDSLSPSDVSSGSQTISKDSSGEPLISRNNQHSRTPSNGTNRISGADNLALVDSGEDEPCIGTAPVTVVTQIVPLAEYHRNSLAEI